MDSGELRKGGGIMDYKITALVSAARTSSRQSRQYKKTEFLKEMTLYCDGQRFAFLLAARLVKGGLSAKDRNYKKRLESAVSCRTI